ncbi:MAG: Gfo/Idh/MocA family oxidoreductase [Actinobacteria bacterium]|jgi:predicted dehydrogenase|nr:Gfo/Idh/MocA family oxidoreductase [Actinomycetota bacterium]
MIREAPVKAVVVGAGPVGAIHARALAAHDSVELVAVCGRTAAKTEALAARHGARPHLSIHGMLERELPDLVCVATGNRDHPGPVMAALEAGADVFVEKPMAWRLDEARAMVEAARSKGAALGVNFNHRFSDPYLRALDYADGEGLGTLAYAAMKFAGDLYKELDDPYCQLIETQGHSFDLLRLFCGDIAEVSAFLADPRGIGVYTSAAINMRFESGAVGALLGSWDGSYATSSSQVLEVAGTEGRIVVEDVIDSVRIFEAGRGDYREWRPGIFDAQGRDFWRTIDRHLHAFIDALLEGRKPPVTAEDGLRALEATYAAIRSFEQGQPITPGGA